MNIRSNAKLWPQAQGPNQKYRDRQRIELPDGLKVDLVGYGRTKSAATEDLITKARQAVQEALVDRSITFDNVFDALIREKEHIDSRKARTIYNNKDLYTRHIQPALGEISLAELHPDQIAEVQARLMKAKKYRTAELATFLIKNILRFTHRLYRTDIQAGILPLKVHPEDVRTVQRPAEAREKARKNEAPPWTTAELSRFLQAAEEQYKASLAHNVYPLFRTAIGAGLRLGELLGLHRTDLITRTIEVDDEEVEIHLLRVNKQLATYDAKFHPETPKSDAGYRDVPIGSELADCLKAHMKRLDKLAKDNARWDTKSDLMLPGLHGQPMDPRNITRAKKQLIDSLKLPHATLHQLRAVYTTLITQELVSQGRYNPRLVMRLLGHSTPDVALRHYTWTMDADLAAAAFNPNIRKSLDKSLDKSAKKKDAPPVESAS